MRSVPKNPESQPTAPDCSDLVMLEPQREKTRAIKSAMTQELQTAKTP
jgi:hypothetical protein